MFAVSMLPACPSRTQKLKLIPECGDEVDVGGGGCTSPMAIRRKTAMRRHPATPAAGACMGRWLLDTEEPSSGCRCVMGPGKQNVGKRERVAFAERSPCAKGPDIVS